MHIISLPASATINLLLEKPGKASIFKILDYILIVNKLNPINFLQERQETQNTKYVWVTHRSYGAQFSEGVLDLCSEEAQPSDKVLRYIQEAKKYNYINFSDLFYDSEKLSDINKIYGENIMELMRFHITQYPKQQVKFIIDQTIQEKVDCKEKYHQLPQPPW